MVTPVFIISLPRSGSTLLQKILTVHDAIHSVNETWLLLPLAHMLDSAGTYTRYNQRWAAMALNNFVEMLPNKKRDYVECVRDFSLSLYQKTIDDHKVKFFLDKTPRYFLIIRFLHEVFPDAKFIFLLRNPLDVISSILMTWKRNRFDLFRYYLDIFKGPELLTAGYNFLKKTSIKIHYEKLVTDPESEIIRICDYLKVEYNNKMTINYKDISLNGEFGDSTGINQYDKISNVSIDKWKIALNTIYRKKFAVNYIENLEDDILETYNLSKHHMISQISKINTQNKIGIKDVFWHLHSLAKQSIITWLIG